MACTAGVLGLASCGGAASPTKPTAASTLDVAAAGQDAAVVQADTQPPVDATVSDIASLDASLPQDSGDAAGVADQVQAETAEQDTSRAPDLPASDVALPPSCATSTECEVAVACLVGICTPKGQCALLPKADGAACSDGNLCTTQDACAAGQCFGSSQLLCDDANPCTADQCNALIGCINPPKAGTLTCDDGEACTVGDTCAGGKCAPGANTCQCKTASDCGKFEDGDACNGTLYCDISALPHVCKVNPATIVQCSTANNSGCQTNTCVPATGACKLLTKPTNTPCDDGNACTEGDSCQSGLCEGGTNTCVCKTDADCAKLEDGDKCNGTLFCNKATAQCTLNPATLVSCQTVDDTQCIKNLCNPKDGKCHLLPVNHGKACDDGNNCTPNETCAAGVCQSATNACECKSNADCSAKEDGNLCNGTLYCDVKSNKCTLNPATVVVCPTGDDGPCVQDTCDPKTGKCTELALPKEGTPCSDGNACTTGDSCKAGKCQAGTAVCPCQLDADCAAKEDGNLCNGTLYCNKGSKVCEVNPASLVACSDAFDETCLTNQCDPATGKCGMKAAHQGNLCQDGSLCSGGGWCQLGVCVVESQSVCECQADNDCGKLEDGDQCNGTLYCDKTGDKPKCAPKPGTVVVCTTKNDTACLKNQCAPATGACALTAVFAQCGDGKVCTDQDSCQNGACIGKPKQCADTEPCTADACVEPFGCQNTPLPGAASCTDGNACTAGDSCVGGACIGTKLVCDDANVCTADACSSAKGCLHVNQLSACTDGNLCTLGDGCDGAGLCKSGTPTDCDDDDLCTADACDNSSGKCTHTDDGSKTCGDGNPCTSDSCDPKIGCAHLFNTLPCNDKNACTSGDVCKGGACSSTGQFACDDGKVCTTDSCDTKVGCVFAANSKSCDDGNPCTPGDACQGGLCIGGQPKTCDDKNPCTNDTCDGKTGECKNVASTDSCDDSNACTQFDQCAAGKCLGKEVGCDDGNGCTNDACVPASGCTNTANDQACDTGNCNADDACSGGKCVAGKTPAAFQFTLPQLAGYPLHVRDHGLGATASGGFVAIARKLSGAAPSNMMIFLDANGKPIFQQASGAVLGAVGNLGGYSAIAGLASGTELISLYTAAGALVSATKVGVDESRALASLAGTLVVAGIRMVSDSGKLVARAMLFRTKSDLSQQWLYTAKVAEAFRAVAVSFDGAVVMAVGNQGNDAFAARLEADTGNALSELVLGGVDVDMLQALAPHPAGGFVAAGFTASKGAGAADGWLVRFGADGQVLWDRTMGSPGGDTFVDVVALSDGLLLAGATSSKGAGDQDNWLVATDLWANPRWERVWGTAAHDVVHNLLLDAKARLVGTTDHSTNGGTVFRRDHWGFDGCAQAGVCTKLTAKDCDDGNPCTTDWCEPSFGCKHIGLPTGSLCADALACTSTGKCTLPAGMVEIPAGKFWMGCAQGDISCASEEKPLHEVTLSAYAIDKLEVTVDQYTACVDANGCTKPGGTYAQTSSWNYGAPNRGNHPINGISRAQAATYCAWAKKRLPTEAEWEKAARGGCDKFVGQDCKAAATTQPWGNAAPSCTLAIYNNGSGACAGATTSPVGGRPGGASPYGLLDMAGNVSEWVSDAHAADYYANSPPVDPKGPTGTAGIKRGGGFSSSASYVRVSARYSADVGTFYTDQGVRCAATVK